MARFDLMRDGEPGGSRGGWGRWAAVAIFAVGMAFVEAAVVLYLRTIIGELRPYPPPPADAFEPLAGAEAVREAATLVMLAAVGWLAGRTWRSRLGYALVAFGVWDIFYYIFLIPLTGWPTSLFDWDILFLLPLPWWGPVIAPVLIALLLIVAGSLLALADRPDRPLWPHPLALATGAAGCGLALYVFMADALRAVAQGPVAWHELVPTSFAWGLFVPALLGMAVPVANLAWLASRRAAGGLAARG